MNALPFDVKYIIASLTEAAWIAFYRYDDEFAKFAVTAIGISDFIRYHTDIDIRAQHTVYRVLGQLHRVGGPAVEYKDGVKRWYQNGKLYRENDLHTQEDSFEKSWLYDHQLHREGLPAFIGINGDIAYYIHGELHRDGDEPAEITNHGKFYFKHGKCHRDGDLPARIYVDGERHWYRDDKFYRENDGPVIEYANGIAPVYANDPLLYMYRY